MRPANGLSKKHHHPSPGETVTMMTSRVFCGITHARHAGTALHGNRPSADRERMPPIRTVTTQFSPRPGYFRQETEDDAQRRRSATPSMFDDHGSRPVPLAGSHHLREHVVSRSALCFGSLIEKGWYAPSGDEIYVFCSTVVENAHIPSVQPAT